MNNADLEFILIIVIWLVSAIVFFWVLWAIIRGAVLSALRKHAEEDRRARTLP